MRAFHHALILLAAAGAATYAVLPIGSTTSSAELMTFDSRIVTLPMVALPAPVQVDSPNHEIVAVTIQKDLLVRSPLTEGATSSGEIASVPTRELIESAATTTAPPSATPAAVAGPQCEAIGPLFCVYLVAEGDTLTGIARALGLKGNEDISAWELLILTNRPELSGEDDVLQVGQRLRVPMRSGVLHTVLSSQTLTEIGSIYQVNPAGILTAQGNPISNPDSLRIGQELFIPEPRRMQAEVVQAVTPAPGAPAINPGGRTATPSVERKTDQSASGFVWPASGPISSYYGGGHPLGIDIDLYASPNAPNLAAAAGTVTFAGGDPCCSYGYYVVVDHGNGFQTLYAHFSKLSVMAGERVEAGEVLGQAGSTGYSTGNHLHFELRLNGVIVNPLSYLP